MLILLIIGKRKRYIYFSKHKVKESYALIADSNAVVSSWDFNSFFGYNIFLKDVKGVWYFVSTD